MRQVVLQSPNHFEMKEVERPARGPGEALVRVKKIGVCGTDLHAYRGRQPFFEYPRVLGHELAVEVVDIDENRAGIRQGDPCVLMPYLACGECIACRNGKTNCCMHLQLFGIHVDGGMQDYMVVPIDDLLKAEGLNLEQMALVENQSIGAHAVRRAQIQPGEYALVIGVGPIGLGVVQFARAAGAEVIALDLDEARLRFCADKLGVQHVINARHSPATRLEEITGGDYATVLFEATGNPRSIMQAFNYVAHGGRYVLVSLVEADITFYDPDFHKRETTLLSSRNALREDFEEVINAMQTGAIVTEPLITHRMPFEEMIDAYDNLLKPETRVIKAVVEV